MDGVQALQALVHLKEGKLQNSDVRQDNTPLLLYADRPQKSTESHGNGKPRRKAAHRDREFRRSLPRGKAQQGRQAAAVPRQTRVIKNTKKFEK